ncbi:MAG: hypothetical protein K2K97_12635, partial [Muribaculaceae bacterium]|nr:hypothetical protein [Muribaculaceae bacterium]
CTSDRHIKNDEMEKLIVEKAVEYHILKNKNEPYDKISNDTFKQLYAILTKLISVEYTQGTKLKYDKTVNEKGVKGGHLYKKFKDGKRLNAFYLEFTIREAEYLRSEIGVIRAHFFNDDYENFAKRFPLLTSMGRMTEIFTEAEDNGKLINKISNTDIFTVNYRPTEKLDLKKGIEEAVKYRLPLYINNRKVLPLNVKCKGLKWSLIAKDIDSNKICMFSLDELNNLTTEKKDSDVLFDAPDVTQFADHIIGIGKLWRDEPYYVTLHLTKGGINSVSKQSSPFACLKPVINQSHTFHCGKYDEAGSASFRVFINEDFFSELLFLEKNGKLISVEPWDVFVLHKEYFEKHMDREYIPLEERSPSLKTLKNPKRNISE